MIKRFLYELRLRRVPQAAGVYLAAGWVAFEVAEGAFPRLGLPDWTVTFVLVLLLVGLPVVIGVAWVFDLTREGIRRTDAAGTAGDGEFAGDRAWRMRGAVIVIAAIIVLGLTGTFFLLRGERELAVDLDADALVVLPFTVRGGTDVEFLSEGMVELLSTKLDGAGDIRSVSPHTVLTHVGRETASAPSSEIARRLGAGLFVLGSVLEVQGDIRLQAAIHRTVDDTEPIAEASVEGSVDAFLDLVDELAAALLVAGELAPAGRLPRIAAMTTEDVSALKFFLAGERALRETRHRAGVEAFQRAVEADTAFALAYQRLALAAGWAEQHGVAQRAVDAAVRHRARLHPRDRALLDAFVAWREGRYEESHRRYRELLESYPADVDAWYGLGEVLSHNGALLGIPLRATGEPFERTVALDPDYALALDHLATYAAWTRDTLALDSITRRMRRRLGDNMPRTIAAQWTFVIGDSAARDSLIEHATGRGDKIRLLYAAWSTDEIGDIRAILDAVARLPHHDFDWMFAHLLATFGARDEALDWLEARESVGDRPLVRTALLATSPLLRTPSDRLEALRAGLLHWDPGPIRTDSIGPTEWGSLEPVFPQLRLYLLALIEALLGRPDAALRWADALEGLGGVPEVKALASDLARHVRARVLLDQGQPADALRVIERASFWEASPWDERMSALYGFGDAILLRGDALHAMGRHRDAIRWHGTFQVAPWLFGYSAYRQAQALEALGDTEGAAARYAVFLRRWAHADPDLRDLANDARRRLGTLSDEH